MKRLIAIVTVLAAMGVASLPVEASVHVRGYYRSNGTYVQPHYRSNPDGNFYNNWSTYPNINPYTGAVGTRRSPSSSPTYSPTIPNYGLRTPGNSGYTWRMPSTNLDAPSYWHDNSQSFPNLSPPSYDILRRSSRGN